MSAASYWSQVLSEARSLGVRTTLLEQKMPPKEIHVIGVDPGVTTGWARVTIPRKCIWGDEPTSIISWETGQLRGRISDQVWELARLARQTQSLAFKIGPALVVEDFDFGRPLKDPEVYTPVYFAQQLHFIAEKTALLNDARVFLQSRALAKGTFTDERLGAAGVFARRGQTDHERDALRHALTALRRAKTSFPVRSALWDAQWAAA